MEIKQILLVPKKNGKGYVTSYTINIGSAEVRKCGFLDNSGNPVLVEKIVDEENNRIIIQPQKNKLQEE